MTRLILRDDIYYADLNPVIGSEQDGIRPVLVVQNDVGNKHSPIVIVAAITTKYKSRLPTHIYLDEIQEPKPRSIALLEQIRTIDKRRLVQYIGSIEKVKLDEIDVALATSIGL